MKRKTNRESFGVMATLFSLLVTTSFVLLRPGESGAQERDATVDLLAELTNAHGVVGFEGEVRDILRREWRGLLTDLRTDGVGNLLGTLKGQSESPRVLLMAHLDEVGFLVRYIDEDGFIYFNTSAAISLRVC